MSGAGTINLPLSAGVEARSPRAFEPIYIMEPYAMRLTARIWAWLGGFGGGRDGRAVRDERKATGRAGERLAARWLRRSGYRILARNFRAAGAEIDLVASEGNTIVFVEVKARRDRRMGAPEEAVDDRKQKRIRRAAEVYLDRYRAHGRPVRFDVVAISGDWPGRRVELFRDAF